MNVPRGCHVGGRVRCVGGGGGSERTLALLPRHAGTASVPRCSTCKPTVTAVPGDTVLGLLSGVIMLDVCYVFLVLHQYIKPQVGAARV